MNTVIVSGRLNADPECKYKEDGAGNRLLIVKYTLVQTNTKGDGWKTDMNFIPCIAFGRVAQIAKEHLRQGKLVTVEGRFQGRLVEHNGERSFFSNVAVRQQVFELDNNVNSRVGDDSGYKEDR